MTTMSSNSKTSALHSKRGKRGSLLALFGWLAISPLLTGCVGTASSLIPPQPTQRDAWLSFKFSANCGLYPGNCGLTDDGEATAYYNAPGITNGGINCDPKTHLCNYTFQDWLTANGFASATQVAHAIYFNKLDLQFGRDMNCWQNGQTIACYVVNYGPSPLNQDGKTVNPAWPNRLQALQDANAGCATCKHTNPPFATVAMVYNPANTANVTSFYVFNNGASIAPFDPTTVQLSTVAVLDTEGAKTAPRMCMGCHGGFYTHSDQTTNPPTPASVAGAQFLPFDVISFGLDASSSGQQAFLDLNAFVLATKPNPAIVAFVNGTYPSLGPVGAPFTQSLGNNIPIDFTAPNWNSNTLFNGTLNSPFTVYNSLVKNYCRMCHLAQNRDFATYDDPNDTVTIAGHVFFGNFKDDKNLIETFACVDGDMPHMEVPFGPQNTNLVHGGIGLWNDPDVQARVALHDFLQAVNTNTNCKPE